MIVLQDFKQQFQQLYGSEPRVFSAPGRVNLIGEHTDYNDGFVLPMAIDRRTYVAAAPRQDQRVRCASTVFEGLVEFDLSAPLHPANDWANHVRGIAACLLCDGFSLRGADLLIASEVPPGAGLSSSAALEIAVGLALLGISGQQADLITLALAAQRAEQEFVGTKCGIMDQYIACLGIEGQALLIDCRSLEYEAVPMELGDTRVVICNSMVKHDLAAGEYNTRRSECEEAVRILSRQYPKQHIQSLRDIEGDLGDWVAPWYPLEGVLARRAAHVVTENVRTLTAVAALKRGDLAQFGKMMFYSHTSLRDDYEVSCRELDLLVEIARGCAGVFGARMTGGGFGGCTVNLVVGDQVENFITTVTRSYERETGLKAECYVCRASEGAREEG
jgi:galactokinase